MSHFEQKIRRELNAQIDARPPLARMVARQRQNFGLKIIALTASILLYFYVQAERNPIAQRHFTAAVSAQDAPPDMEVEPVNSSLMVTISGPTDVIERLNDRDIRVVANVSGAALDSSKPQSFHAKFEINGLDKQTTAKLTFEPPEPSVKIRLFATITRQMKVRATYSHDAPAGYEYGLPDVNPAFVNVTGRSDVVGRVEEALVSGAPQEAGAHIEKDFPVLAHDREGNSVPNVKIDPPMVRLSVPLVERPPSRIVTVSVITSGLPLPPYSLAKITATPAQVRITGRQRALDGVSTIETEILPVGDLTQTQETTAHLILPGSVRITDLNNRPIDAVRVRIEIEKAPAPVPPKTEPKPAPPVGTKKTEGSKQ